ncbi:MAG: alpha/beta hydrolase [Sphingomonas sp.]|nr:alpha/beta hydrolase [Sphingomonas sp.]
MDWIRMSARIAVTTLAVSAASAFAAEREITVPGPQGALHGTLLKPDAPGPVVLIIPGSGPTDRDGNNPLGVRGAPYAKLANALAARGIASVRADKRGQFASMGAVVDPNAVTIADYAADAQSWVAAARAATGAPCVWLLGHSEGGLVALATGAGPGICGHILVAASGRPLGSVIRAQLRANPANAPILAQAEGALDALEAGKRVDTAVLHPALANLFAPAVQGYLIDLFRHDPAMLAKRLSAPMLIVQGDQDLQIGVEDARTLAAARPDAVLAIIPGVNHVLRQVGTSGDRAANLASYGNAELPVDAGVVDAIAGFVRGKR